MTDERSERSFVRLTNEHLIRLADLAAADDIEFRAMNPVWAAELLACCLVQGGARHYLHGDRGVKDLDVYLFYAMPEGRHGGRFPRNRGGATRYCDFGVSELGRQRYTSADLADPHIRPKIPRFERFSGRRVDLISRAIEPDVDGPRVAVKNWLERGAQWTSKPNRVAPSAWHLSRTPVVSLYPIVGETWWTGPDLDEAGIEKGVYG